jgi:hypothetical protein
MQRQIGIRRQPGMRSLKAKPSSALRAAVCLLFAGAFSAIAYAMAPQPALPAIDIVHRPEATMNSRELGFVVSTFHYAIYPGMTDNCPAGFANTNSDAYLASLSPAERARLSKPENEEEFSRLWKASVRGPDNTNLCTNFDQFPERGLQRTVQGKVSYGLDLDGKKHSTDTCAHEEFDGPAGERGIDNQAYRAMGCMRMWRSSDGTPGDFIRYQQEWLSSGEFTNVLVLRGVDSLANDDEVEVIVASSLDQPVVDAQQRFIDGATYALADNPRWRNVLKGRIRDGVLTTQAKDIVLRQPIQSSENMPRMLRTENVFRQGRLRLTFQPNGSVRGVMAGYAPLLQLFERSAVTGVGATDVVNYDCAASYNTLKRLADGGRDPKTGQCTTISTAFEVAAVPAFVVEKRGADRRTAGAAR